MSRRKFSSKLWKIFTVTTPKKLCLSTWIGTIARNSINDYFKRASFQRESLMDEPMEDSAKYSYVQEEKSSFKDPSNERLYNILRHLSDDERDFLELRYSLELKNQEIANILGISVKAVDNRYRRLLEKCRKIAAENSI
ncbi:MAG: RNA polymerase sigma factor [Selenomonadaceae bacterium]|nr:RNA polymerase sigma factor [Selenomonadaceae bacterium]